MFVTIIGVNYMIFKQLMENLDIDASSAMGEFKLSLFGFRAMMIENYTKIVVYSKEKIVLKCKKGFVTIEGDNFNIKEMGKTDLTIVGQIKSIVNDR